MNGGRKWQFLRRNEGFWNLVSANQVSTFSNPELSSNHAQKYGLGSTFEELLEMLLGFVTHSTGG
jgi:hypothetical protein